MKTTTLPRQQHKKLMTQIASREDVLAWIDQNGCLVIGIGVLKGGTGKTTSAIFLALYLAILLGLKVAVVDTDDNSQTVDAWYRIREQRTPPEEVPFDLVNYDPKDEEGPDLDDVIEALKESHQVVIVDIGGAGKETYWEMCKAAHLVILPVAPSGYEVSRIRASIRQATKGAKANPDLRVSICMVKCDGRTTLPDEQRPVLEAIVASEETSKVSVSLVPKEFEISNSPDYPRSWETTPRRQQLEEFGMLIRHVMKGFVA